MKMIVHLKITVLTIFGHILCHQSVPNYCDQNYFDSIILLGNEYNLIRNINETHFKLWKISYEKELDSFGKIGETIGSEIKVLSNIAF